MHLGEQTLCRRRHRFHTSHARSGRGRRGGAAASVTGRAALFASSGGGWWGVVGRGWCRWSRARQRGGKRGRNRRRRGGGAPADPGSSGAPQSVHGKPAGGASPGGCCGRNGTVGSVCVGCGLTQQRQGQSWPRSLRRGCEKAAAGGNRQPRWWRAPSAPRPRAHPPECPTPSVCVDTCVYGCRPPLGGDRRTRVPPRDRTGHAQGPRPLWRQRAPRAADTMLSNSQ